ncbi:MAG: hypothetical protein Q7R52_04845 [archaeon]|nr:hypothetical protein [archaeon]
MKFLGFNFTKINSERLNEFVKDLKIETNVDISSVEKTESDFFKSDEELLVVKFKYSLNYTPELAKIYLEGNVLIAEDQKITKEILKGWKDKDLPENFKMNVLNFVLRKVNFKALQLEEELNLPYHIPFPRVSVNKDKE